MMTRTTSNRTLIVGCFEEALNAVLLEALRNDRGSDDVLGISSNGTATHEPESWTPDFGLKFLSNLLKKWGVQQLRQDTSLDVPNAQAGALFARHLHEIKTHKDFQFVCSNHNKSIAMLEEYWYQTIREAKVRRVLFCNTPHHLFDYVGLLVAQENGLQILILNELRELPGRVFLTRGIRDLGYSAAQSEGKELENSESDESDYVASWLEMLQRLSDGKGSDTVRGLADAKARVAYTKGSTSVRMLGYLRVSARLWSPYGLIRKGLDKQLLHRSRRELAEVTSRSLSDLTSAQYVYFPLHQQPEATTCPKAGRFVDQRLIVQTLLAGLPKSWKIVVKEHPDQFLKSYPRIPGFYRELCRDSRIYIAPIETPSVTLLSNATAVATAGSSAVGQALSLRKPVLLFGYSPFSAHKSVFRVWTSSDVRRFVQEYELQVPWDEKADEVFIRKVLRRTFVGCLSSMNGLSPQEWKANSAPLLRFLQSWANEARI